MEIKLMENKGSKKKPERDYHWGNVARNKMYANAKCMGGVERRASISFACKNEGR